MVVDEQKEFAIGELPAGVPPRQGTAGCVRLEAAGDAEAVGHAGIAPVENLAAAEPAVVNSPPAYSAGPPPDPSSNTVIVLRPKMVPIPPPTSVHALPSQVSAYAAPESVFL